MTLVFVGIGLLAGVLAGIFGIGGGIIIVPSLVFFAKMTQKLATGTSIAVFLLPVGALGAYTHWRAGNVDIRAAMFVALGLFAGSWLGSNISVGLSEQTLKRTFAVLLVAIAIRLWLTPPAANAAAKTASADAAGAHPAQR